MDQIKTHNCVGSWGQNSGHARAMTYLAFVLMGILQNTAKYWRKGNLPGIYIDSNMYRIQKKLNSIVVENAKKNPQTLR